MRLFLKICLNHRVTPPDGPFEATASFTDIKQYVISYGVKSLHIHI